MSQHPQIGMIQQGTNIQHQLMQQQALQQQRVQHQQAQQQQQQQQQQQPQHTPAEDKFLTKVRDLASGPLKQKWSETLREAANQLYLNGCPDAVPDSSARFELKLEDFISTCDQIELLLRGAIECQQQSVSSGRYMPVTPQLSRADSSPGPRIEFLNYNQYLNVVKQQIHFATETRNILHQAAKDLQEQTQHQMQQQQLSQQQHQQQL